MKKLLIALGLVLVCQLSAYADEPAIVNAPGNAYENFKRAIGTVEPSADAMWNANGREFKVGSSIRLYSLEKVRFPVVNDLDFRLGWFETVGLYGTFSLALDRVTGKDVLKYVHVGWMFGADFDQEGSKWVTGPVVGAKLAF